MFEFQEKRKVKSIIYSYPVVAVLFILLVIVGRATWNVYQKENESAENLALIQNELNSLQARKAYLQVEVERLKTTRGVEGEIRQKFQVAKEGEHIAVIIPEALVKDVPASTTPKGWWQFWK